MEKAIEKLVESISTYEILNNLIPGVIYVVLFEKLTTLKIQTGQTWIDFILYYFIGVVIGRIGSLVVEKFLKDRGKLDFTSHAEYVKAEKQDEMIRSLSAINNMYRTYVALTMTLLFTVGFHFIWNMTCGNEWVRGIIIVTGCLLLMLLFGYSYIKQTRYVSSRVKTVNNTLQDE